MFSAHLLRDPGGSRRLLHADLVASLDACFELSNMSIQASFREGQVNLVLPGFCGHLFAALLRRTRACRVPS